MNGTDTPAEHTRTYTTPPPPPLVSLCPLCTVRPHPTSAPSACCRDLCPPRPHYPPHHKSVMWSLSSCGQAKPCSSLGVWGAARGTPTRSRPRWRAASWAARSAPALWASSARLANTSAVCRALPVFHHRQPLLSKAHAHAPQLTDPQNPPNTPSTPSQHRSATPQSGPLPHSPSGNMHRGRDASPLPCAEVHRGRATAPGP